jgi:hypothetical protein
MAIRPVDLQLAYLAAPQNAAVVSSAQEAPQAAQQAAQAAFAAELVHREEQVDAPASVEGQRIRPREEQDASQDGGSQQRRRRQPASEDSPELPPPVFRPDGEHFIDVTA